MTSGVGLHLMLDGLSSRKLIGQELVSFIRACTEEISMTLISRPRSYKVMYGRQAHGIIAESHITVMAMDDRRTFVDVFSCKPFNTDSVVQVATLILGMNQGMKMKILHRAGTATPATP